MLFEYHRRLANGDVVLWKIQAFIAIVTPHYIGVGGGSYYPFLFKYIP